MSNTIQTPIYCQSRKFPPYSFIHGKNLNPNRKNGYREGVADPIVAKINSKNYFDNKDYLFAIDLINHGYYWESHVYFEAIWHAHHRKGPTANYCKALLKIAAGAIKLEQEKTDSAKRLFNGARKLLSELPKYFYLGINIVSLIQLSLNWELHGKQLLILKK